MPFIADRLNPLKRAPAPRRVVAFDTEGVGGPGGFILGSVVDESGDVVFHDPSEMLRYLTAPRHYGCWLFAHNLEYDLAVLTGGDLRMLSCLFIHSRLLWAETQDANKHIWRFCDSLNLFPGMSVADLGAFVDLPKRDLPAALSDITNDRCAHATLTPAQRRDIGDYCLRDAQIVYRAVQVLQAELLHLGGALQPTIAGCAMDLYRRRYQPRPFRTPHPAMNNLARSAFYGGRVEPYRMGRVSGVNGYDVNSLYPSAQVEVSLPDCEHSTFDLHPATNHAHLHYPGISYVTVDIPECDVPPLPVRSGGRLFFACGRVTGVWCHNELRYALDHGVHILSTRWTQYSTQSLNPFRGYSDDLYERKAACGDESSPKRLIYKLLLNSLYGRWGIVNDGSLAALLPVTSTEEMRAAQSGELRMIGDWPYLLTAVGTDHQPPYCQVSWAAHITAQARISMHGRLAQSAATLVYTDTDSLWTTGQVAVSDGLGGLRQTHEGVDLWVVAPKEYAVFHNESLLVAHAKGIPESLRLLYLEGLSVAFDSPVGLLESPRKGVPPATWIERLRQRRYAIPKRAPVGQSSTQYSAVPTRPWMTQELAEMLTAPEAEQGLCPVVLG